jgi:hypothetical protein
MAFVDMQQAAQELPPAQELTCMMHSVFLLVTSEKALSCSTQAATQHRIHKQSECAYQEDNC